MTCWIKFKRLENNDLPLPKYATDGSAAFDIKACTMMLGTQRIEVGSDTVFVNTGFKVEFPSTHVLIITIRSSMGARGLRLANGIGVIDSDYRGEILLPLQSATGRYITVRHSQRVCQGLLLPVCVANIIEANDLSETGRGDGGFGSTGK